MENFIKTMPQKVEEALACGQTLSDMESKDHLLVKQDLKKLFLDNFCEHVDVHFFGSRLMGLANEKSDADIFVDVGGAYHSPSSVNGTDWVQKTKGTFMIDSKFEFIYAVPFAIVPILIVKHVATGWSCDISFSHGLGVEMSLFVKHLFKLQPEAKKLALYVCIWCKNYEIKIKNFFLVVLVIFYMQTKGLLPSVKRVQDRCSLRQIGDYTVGFDKSNYLNSFALQRIANYRDHINGFFNYFATFDYSRHLMCPYLGKILGKTERSSDMDAIKRHIGSGVCRWNQFQEMVILHPFNSGHNLTNALKSNELDMFKENCQLACSTELFLSFLKVLEALVL